MRSDQSQDSVSGSALYVDIENLREGSQAVIEQLLDNWPAAVPAAKRLCLYVPAENLDLWEMWAKSRFPAMAVVVRGVQHYSFHPSKNAADMAIAMDALSDLVLRRADHIVVMSDDSDFIALYAKVKEIHEESGHGKQAPFLWVLTDRKDTRSGTIRDYFPNDHIHVIHFPETRRGTRTTSRVSAARAPARAPSRTSPTRVPGRAPAPPTPAVAVPAPPTPAVAVPAPPTPAVAVPAPPAPAPERRATTDGRARGRDRRGGRYDAATLEQMAQALLRELPVGTFKSTDCQDIIKRQWPTHDLATSSVSGFGTKFVNSLLPILGKYGVTEPNTNRRPRRYEITREAKTSVQQVPA